jgi:hypothetical protein
LPPALGQFPQFRCEFIERGIRIGGKRLAKDFPMLCLGRAPVTRSAALQLGDKLVIQIAHMQVSGHLALCEVSESNDLKYGRLGQPEA